MTLPTLTQPPVEITRGDAVRFTASVPGLDARGGGVMRYTIAGVESIIGTVAGDAWSFLIPADVTQAIVLGDRRWSLRYAQNGEPTTVRSGFVRVLPNLALAEDVALSQSFAERTLPIVEAALNGTIAGEMRLYMIGGRQVQTFSPAELMELRARLTVELRATRSGGMRSGILFGTRRPTSDPFSC